MRSRTVAVAGAGTVALAAASVAAIAATRVSVHTNGVGLDRVAAATCAAPASLPGQRVTVVLADMGHGAGSMMGGTMADQQMMLRPVPRTVHAGTVSLAATNRGTRTHELVVLPLGPGGVVGARDVGPGNTVSEAGSLGEASTTCGSGPGDGIATGATGWVTLTLTAGRYELVCNLPGHYAAGMYAELDVTG